MTDRSYGHYCGLAAALDRVGERWALLVVRELLFGPQRYSDLLERLPGISTNVLADRIRELERSGIVRQRRLPPPAASTVYELSERGRELEEAILALGRWGGRGLGAPSKGLAFHPAWGLLALQASFQPDRAPDLSGEFELTIDGRAFTVQVDGPRTNLREGHGESPDLVMSTDSRTFLELGFGRLSTTGAIERGRLEARGDPTALDEFFEVFRFPAAEGVPTP